MGEREGGVLCGTISGILGLVFFIYLMVAFSTVNLKDLTGLVPFYVDMINWVKYIAYADFAVISSIFVFGITSICSIVCCGEGGAYVALLLFSIFFLGAYIIQVVFVAQGVPIIYNTDYICQQDNLNSNYTQMCNFHDGYFNPLFIILCLLLGINSINFIILAIVVLAACLD
jgi:hypothetical protein